MMRWSGVVRTMGRHLAVVLALLAFAPASFAGDGEREGNLGLLAGAQTTPNSSGIFGFSLNHVRPFNWGGGIQFTWQPYVDAFGFAHSIFQIDLDSVYYIPGTERGLYLGIIGGINLTGVNSSGTGQVYGDLGGVVGWDIHLQEGLSIGIEVQDVAAPVFGNAAMNELNLFAALKFWGHRRGGLSAPE